MERYQKNGAYGLSPDEQYKNPQGDDSPREVPGYNLEDVEAALIDIMSDKDFAFLSKHTDLSVHRCDEILDLSRCVEAAYSKKHGL